MIPAHRIAELVEAAAAGDSHAWDALVAGFTPMVRSVARRHRLSLADQDEVLQNTWLKLLKYIGRLREPAALAGWLATTARNESIRVLHDGTRTAHELEDAAVEPCLDDTFADDLELRERKAAVRAALSRASDADRLLMSALMVEPARSYTEVSEELRMPVGSIGPTRARILARLRRDPMIAGRMAEEFAPPARATRPSRAPVEL